MAYLLSTYRRSVPGYHDHIAVYATLEDAQMYSTQIGGVGEWDSTVYDGVELWARDTKEPDVRHRIEWVNYYQAAADTDLEARVKALEDRVGAIESEDGFLYRGIA